MVSTFNPNTDLNKATALKRSAGGYIPGVYFKYRFNGSVVLARPGATGCDYETIFAFYRIGFPSPHFDILGLGQGFKV